MTGESPAQSTEHPIATHLRNAGITKAIIIDDIYDPPNLDTHRDGIADFWDTVLRDPETLEELRGLKPNINDPSEFDNELLSQLWQQREILPKLGPILKSGLFVGKIGDLATLQPLCDSLSELGIEPVPIGSEQPLPSEPFKLVFIDYILGPGSSEAVHRANGRAMDIYHNVPADADKPFIVLMSSKPDAEAAKDNFRNASKLLGGLFGYVPKNDLRDKERLYLHLAIWAIGMPTRHEIQHFVEAVESAAESAKEHFVQRVRALGFEDYVNIQWLSLQSEGHPLGDYMLWLYKSLLAYLLHDNPRVLEQQKKLDAMAFEQFTPSQSGPSPQLAEIYRFALTEPGVGEVGPHPRASGDNAEPLLCLGDLFFKEQSHEVLMVINAACDLAYSPGTKRAFPRERSILLLHGMLQRYEEIDTSDSIRTDLFNHEGKAYRILWDHRRVISKPYGEIKEWLSHERYSRKSRLSLPYALQVQQAFTLGIMRIGMPIKPPHFRHADVEVYCANEDDNYMLVGETIHDGVLIIRRKMEHQDKDEDLFLLTLDCIGKIVGSLDTVIKNCERQKAKLNEGKSSEEGSGPEAKKDDHSAGKIMGLDGKLAKLEQLKSLSQKWVPAVLSPNPLPPAGKKKEINPALLWVYRNGSFDGKYKGPPIVL